MKKNKILLTLIALICTSCTHVSNGKVDLTALQSNKDKFGIVVLRSLDLDQYNNLAQAKLTPGNGVYMLAKGIKNSQQKQDNSEYEIGYSWKDFKQQKEKQKLFTITPEVNNLLSPKPAILKPEYFYEVKMLPAGDYYISYIAYSCQGINLNVYCLYKDFDQKESPFRFTVKAGVITYLGDLYLANGKANDLLWFSYPSTDMLIINKTEEAKKFIQQYHPELHHSFITKIMKEYN